MSTDDVRADVRALLEQFLQDAATQPDRAALLEGYTHTIIALYSQYAHQLLTDVINDAHVRLDARLAPDPFRQTIATVQTTIQDVWKTLTQSLGDEPPK